MRTTLSIAALLFAAFALNADELRGKVVSITDGDTVIVLDDAKTQHKIRLEGIDAPEKSQPFGQKSKAALGEKIHEKQVVVRWSKRDQYKRIIGDIYLGDRRISQEMIAEGWAWHFKRYNSEKILADAEIAAREAKRGLWADPNPVAPWDYRKMIKQSPSSSNIK